MSLDSQSTNEQSEETEETDASDQRQSEIAAQQLVQIQQDTIQDLTVYHCFIIS